MASINGISIKNIKRFKGHEGEPLAQATVYVDGKRTGFWSQGDWGGEDDFDHCYDIIKDRAEQFAKGYPKSAPYANIQNDPACFMTNLLMFTDHEKIYKKNISSLFRFASKTTKKS